jgi:hypothetical protein
MVEISNTVASKFLLSPEVVGRAWKLLWKHNPQWQPAKQGPGESRGCRPQTAPLGELEKATRRSSSARACIEGTCIL